MGATGLCDNIEDNIQNNVCTQSASTAPNNLHENGSVTCDQIRQPDTCLLLPLQTCVHTKQITVRGLYIWCPCCKHTRLEPRPCQTLACTFESDNLCFKISLAGRVNLNLSSAVKVTADVICTRKQNTTPSFLEGYIKSSETLLHNNP